MATKFLDELAIARQSAERIKELCETLGLTREKLAQKIDVPYKRFTSILGTQSVKPTIGLLVKIAAVTDANPTWLLTGRGPMLSKHGQPGTFDAVTSAREESVAYVKRAPVQLAAGDGSFPVAELIEKQNGEYTPYPKEEIKRLAASANTLIEMEVFGDSMFPTLVPGERILIDTDRNITLKDAIWAVRFEGALLIKRVQLLPGGLVRLASDNDKYKPVEIKLDGSVDFDKIGRMVMVAKRF